MSVPLYIHGGSDVGRQRQQNEDCFRVVQRADGSWVLVVCDGMGGHEAGEVASAVASQRIVEVLASSAPVEPPRALYDALMEANRAVLETARARGTPSMGTTAVAAWVLETRCYVGWVGDSRLYHFRQGQVIERSRDHTRVEQMVQHGILTPEQAKLHPDAHVLLRALGGSAGAHQDFRPEVWNEPLELRSGDVVLLCSDGLYDLIEDAELYPLMERRDAQGAVDTLIRTANERGGNDNITAVLLVVGQPEVPVAGAAAPTSRRDTLPDGARVVSPDVPGASASRGDAMAMAYRGTSQDAPGMPAPHGGAPDASGAPHRRETLPETPLVAALVDTSGTARPAASELARAWPPGGDAPHSLRPVAGARAVGGTHPPSVAASPAESRRGPLEGGGTRRVPMVLALSCAAGTLLVGGLLGWWFGRGSAADAPAPASRTAVMASPAPSTLMGAESPPPSAATSPVASAGGDAGLADAGDAARVEQAPSAAPATAGMNVPSAPAQPSAVAPSVEALDGGVAPAPVAGDAGTVGAPRGNTPAPAPAPKPKKKAGASDPKSSAPETPASGAASGGQGT